jgi:hypothetical protein
MSFLDTNLCVTTRRSQFSKLSKMMVGQVCTDKTDKELELGRTGE